MTQSTPHPDPNVNLPDDPLTDHEYDGIREYDNPTPSWWTYLFVLSVIFSVFYVIVFHVGVGPSVHDGYEAAAVRRMQMMFGEIGDLSPDRQTILTYMQDPEWLKVGESVFAGRCATCHGSNGDGTAAPNLTDDLYIHVNNVEDIAYVVTNGANQGSMPAWKAQLHINEIVLVSAYVANMRGKNLPTAGWGGVMGEPIADWPELETPTPAE